MQNFDTKVQVSCCTYFYLKFIVAARVEQYYDIAIYCDIKVSLWSKLKRNFQYRNIANTILP